MESEREYAGRTWTASKSRLALQMMEQEANAGRVTLGEPKHVLAEGISGTFLIRHGRIVVAVEPMEFPVKFTGRI